MRVSEMKEREDFASLLHGTLSAGWSEQFGCEIRVSEESEPDSLAFRYHPILGAYYTADLCEAGRRFLRQSIRFTPNRNRLLAQWFVTDLAGSRLGFKVLDKQGFHVHGPLAHANHLVVVPGNQRLRIFDFKRMKTRVLLKQGFDPSTMQREIQLRSSSVDGPFWKIDAASPDGSFLEEPIVGGWDVNRIPPWISRKKIQQLARKRLLRWLERTREEVSRDEYLETLVKRIHRSSREVEERFGHLNPHLESWCDGLRGDAGALAETLETSLTHGDFQWGNVFLRRGDETVLLIDWEHNGRRSFHYDFFTEALGGRRGAGLAARVKDYLGGQSLASPLDGLGPVRRRGFLAIFLLETLLFFLQESLSGTYRNPSKGLLILEEELQLLGPTLSGLQGGGG
jgi:hypothetical protein